MELKEATELFRVSARNMEAVLAMAEHLERIGNLDVAAKQAESAVSAATKELKRLQADIVKERETAAEESAKAKVLADKNAAQSLDAAKTAAEKIMNNTVTQADRIIAEASSKSNDASAAAKTAWAEAKKAKDATVAAKEELATLETRIASARTTISKLMEV
jgi:Zn-dependent M32 family carboxypeptidase